MKCVAIKRPLLPAVNLISTVIDVLSRHVRVMSTVTLSMIPLFSLSLFYFFLSVCHTRITRRFFRVLAKANVKNKRQLRGQYTNSRCEHSRV